MSVSTETLFFGAISNEVVPSIYIDVVQETERRLKTEPLKAVVAHIGEFEPRNCADRRFWPIISANDSCEQLLKAAGCPNLPCEVPQTNVQPKHAYELTQLVSWNMADGMSIDVARAITHPTQCVLDSEWLLSLNFPDTIEPFVMLRGAAFPGSQKIEFGYGSSLQEAHPAQIAAFNSVIQWLAGREMYDIAGSIDVLGIK
jgi:hypothetical protein